MKGTYRAIAAWALFVPFHVHAETFRLTARGDTTICAHPDERDFNAGAWPRLKLKGNENLVLIDFDGGKLSFRRVVKATLRIKAAGAVSVRRVGVSTIGCAWNEGAGAYAPAGGATFRGPATGRSARWAGPESDFTDAVFGRGGTIWSRVEARAERGGWWSMAVDPRIVEAMGAGLTQGLALADDSGQTRANNLFCSREQAGAAPVLEVEAGEQRLPDPDPERFPVTVVGWSAGADEGHGGVEVVWDGPPLGASLTDTLGYRARIGVNGEFARELPRWMVPSPMPGMPGRLRLSGYPPNAAILAEIFWIGRPDEPGRFSRGAGFASPAAPAVTTPAAARPPEPASGEPPAANGITVWAVPDGVQVNPVTGRVLEEPAAGGWRRANPAWSGRDRAIRLAGLRGEWLGCSLVVEGAGPVRIVPGPLKGPGGAVLGGPLRLFRVVYQPFGPGPADWAGDPLVPVAPGEPVAVPARGQAPAAQRNQAFYVEQFVPESARPGVYAGALEVRGATDGTVSLRLTVDVAGPAMPREAHFVFSLNGYEPPADERATYALAHEHRGTLAILHYSHSGTYADGAVPPVAGAGAAARVTDWAAWDRRFGPLFDGTAFAGTTRPGVPLDHFYLALSEHYPTPMAGAYRWNDTPWEDHWKAAGPIEEGFTADWRARWIATARDWERHVKGKGWRTAFLVYLNDKYDYKRTDPASGRRGRGVSFWELDEPVHPDDFLALRFFGGLLREAVGAGPSPLRFRADVSYPEWSRDLLDPVLDLEVSAGWPDRRRLLDRARAACGRTVWTYGTPAPATAPSLRLSARALELWTNGIDGDVPWLVLGAPADWATPADTAIIYPGGPEGTRGPVASLRLKAFRRAEQDVEYAWLWAKRRGLLDADPLRRRTARLLAPLLRAPAEPGEPAPEGSADPVRLEAFRRTLSAAL